jgi:Mechanosensitive ion channel
MRKTQLIAALVLLALVGFTLYGIRHTAQPGLPAATFIKDPANTSAPSPATVVDQTPLKTAQKMAQLAALPEERILAQEALRLADYEVDLAFDSTLHEALLHPPPLTPQAKEAQARLQKAEKILKVDQDRAKLLAELIVKTPPDKQDTVEVDLVQAEADLDLDQDEVDDAKQDLVRAGSDLIGRIQVMKQEHEETAHSTASAIPNSQPAPDEVGLIHRAQQWTALHSKKLQLWDAKSQAEAAAAAASLEHNTLDAKIETQKTSSPELAHHAKTSKAEAPVDRVSAANKSRDDSAALLKKTEQLAADQKTLSALDKRAETSKELAAVYAQWIDIVSARQRQVIHIALMGLLIILIIALLGVFFSSWVDQLVQRLSMDRRQIQSLRTVTRVSLQFLAALLILLVIFGPPGQLGTFLGLAGAGLTVALKDFIVGFFGWFVLMGRNGIRLGDWVEINGVSGEVAEIGPFHTVLLETGNWTDSGHPTGRRVTFTNSFAIEGHYFNFSTSGQWLWDELRLVLPSGKDSYPIIEAFQKTVVDATRESARQAEEEWRRATSSREVSGFSATPAISVKPVLGGVELSVRYITRANERFMVRSKLNQAAVDLIGGKPGEVSTQPAQQR